MSKYVIAKKACEKAKELIVKKGFADLLETRSDGIGLMVYSDQELRRMNEENGWAGQYVAGSIDSPEGLTVLLNITPHRNQKQMRETILHEVGHALWELLDAKSKALWNRVAKNYKRGAGEGFADAFMQLCSDDIVYNEVVFRQITTPA